MEGDRVAPRVDAPRHRAQDPNGEAPASAAVRRRGARDGALGDRGTDDAQPDDPDAGLPSDPRCEGRAVGGYQGAAQGRQEARRDVQRGAEDRHLPAAARLGVLRRAQRRPRFARQRRPASDLGLDARRRRLAGP